MEMINLSLHDVLIFLSFNACIAGLFLLSDTKQTQADDLEDSEQMLFRMTFAYWIVYCVAASIQKIISPDWNILLINLKITAALSYILTFSCVLSLPLHRMSVRRQVE